MHTIDIPAAILARVAQSRAQRHMFGAIDPRRTAHIVVDLQNGFMEQGAPVEVPLRRVRSCRTSTESRVALRDAGGTIVYLRFKTDAGALVDWSAFYDCFFDSARRSEMMAAFGPDKHHFALWPELDVQASDWIVDKTRFQCFCPQCLRPARPAERGRDRHADHYRHADQLLL